MRLREQCCYHAGCVAGHWLQQLGSNRRSCTHGISGSLGGRLSFEAVLSTAGPASPCSRVVCLQVQDAILHNKRIFEQRMMSEGRALQRRCLHGWLVLMQQKAAKRSKLARAQGRIQWGLLLRVFYSWKDELPHVDKTLAMKRKVRADFVG